MSSINQTKWLPSKQEETIQADQIHVWRVAFPKMLSSSSKLYELLDSDEKAKADRFHFTEDSNKFIISHAVTRLILSGYAHEPSAELRFAVNEFGKPALLDSQLHFNLSHSGNFALIAVTPITSVGVDIEKVVAARAKLDLATRFFSNTEVIHLKTLEEEHFVQGFFNAWTRKEAYIKALGVGLSIPLDSFSVSVKPGEETKLLQDKNEERTPEEWTLVDLHINENHAGALAIKAKHFELKLLDWSGPN